MYGAPRPEAHRHSFYGVSTAPPLLTNVEGTERQIEWVPVLFVTLTRRPSTDFCELEERARHFKTKLALKTKVHLRVKMGWEVDSRTLGLHYQSIGRPSFAGSDESRNPHTHAIVEVPRDELRKFYFRLNRSGFIANHSRSGVVEVQHFDPWKGCRSGNALSYVLEKHIPFPEFVVCPRTAQRCRKGSCGYEAAC